MATDSIRVLIVDGDVDRRRRTVELLEQSDRLDVVDVGTVAAAGAVVLEEDIDVIVSEHELPDGTEADVFSQAARQKPEVGRFLFTDAPAIMEFEGQAGTLFEWISRQQEDAGAELRERITELYDSNAFAPYPVPEDEAERRSILEQYPIEPDERLDELTAEAAATFDVDKASIRVIEREEQRYISCHGFDADRLERGRSICTHTILEDDVLVIPDVQSDERFADEPLFEEEGIHWYAGAVIRLNGHPVGTFCLEDAGRGREFSRAERDRLQEFADRAAAVIALRKAQREDLDLETIIDAAVLE